MEPLPQTKLSRLLVPLDGSRLAESVLPTVSALATRLGAEAVLVHILESRAPATVHGERHLVAAGAAAAYLDEVAERLRGQDVPAEVHVHDAPEGNLARSLIDHTEEYQPSLVVLCAHGRGGVRDVLYGSIALQVLKGGTRPVLIVQPGPDGSAPSFDPGRILVPLDGRHAHEEALAMAGVIAGAFGAELELVLVVPTMKTLRGEQAATGMLLPSATRALLDMDVGWATSYLEQEVGACRASGLEAASTVLRGDVVPEVLAEAERTSADLIAMTSHGRAGLDALLSGSVMPRIAAHARRPLLVTRGTE